MFRSSTFEKTLENATSHLRLEPDWPSILLICDTIRQNDVTPKQAFQAIKKKMSSPNPHSACYALLVLESVVKNCGQPIHEEVFTKENCEMFSTFLEQTPHENVRQKMLELVQTWAYAFRSSEKYQSIKDTMTILKAKGHTFPELKEADAMFTADTAPDWADGKVCHRCRVEFSFTQRKHHCRNCGQIFCSQCSTKQCPLPKYGIEKDVRVCDGCYTSLQKPSSVKPRPTENDLPAEYLNSSLAQQVQTPPRKSEQELKEEEELQLALALSQSEAELKKKQPTMTSYRMLQRSPSPEAPPSTPGVVEDPDLAKYLNRSYWEQRKVNESPASPSAPSPMPQVTTAPVISNKMLPDEVQIDEFANNMRSQVEIFVNRMKSNSSRGRSISNDSSVQTLFMTLTSLHSNQLSYIKEMDDKRMWYEQLQDKLAQIKDSRAALDVLRQEHVEKLRRIAEEQERQRQIQMAQKLEIMRKKKQEYLQYQRQLALQRIQEQEREMQMRQEQQKAQYRMGQTAFPFMPNPNQHASPNHQMNNIYNPYGFNPNSPGPLPQTQFNPQGPVGPQPGQQQVMGASQPGIQPNMNAAPMPGMYTPGMPGVPMPNHPGMMVTGMPHAVGQHMSPLPNQTADGMPNINVPNPNTPQQHQHSQQMNTPLSHVMLQQQNIVQNQSPIPTGMIQTTQAAPPSMVHPMQQPPVNGQPIGGPVPMANMNPQQQQPPPVQTTNAPPQQMTSSAPIDNRISEPQAPQQPKVEEPPKEEVTTAELISFD